MSSGTKTDATIEASTSSLAVPSPSSDDAEIGKDHEGKHHHHHRKGSHRRKHHHRRESTKSKGDTESVNLLPLPENSKRTDGSQSSHESSQGSQGSETSIRRRDRAHKPKGCCGRLCYWIKHTRVGTCVRRGYKRCRNKLETSETLSSALLVFCVVGMVALFICIITLPIVIHNINKRKKTGQTTAPIRPRAEDEEP